MPESSKSEPHAPPDAQTESTAGRKVSRRQFGRDAALVAASLSAPVVLAAAAGPPAFAQKERPEPLKGLTPQQVASVEAKLANILRKYGSRFSDAQKKRLRRILAQQERLLAPVLAFKVENGDPPASVLRVSFDGPGSNMREGGGE
ncbi:MAG TPA: hypothetical protein VLY23_07105 [Candidatus Acidoferrum sp.]|nr:hypothetical protein [Candidatus Acidoferrum sp.]